MATTLIELRRTRRARRLGDTEWFDLAYHVYLAGIFGGSAIIVASDYIGDEQLGEQAIASSFAHGPAVLGLLAVIALIGGLRSGSEGGPVSVESADVVHLLLAPVRRSRVLRAGDTRRPGGRCRMHRRCAQLGGSGVHARGSRVVGGDDGRCDQYGPG